MVVVPVKTRVEQALEKAGSNWVLYRQIAKSAKVGLKELHHILRSYYLSGVVEHKRKYQRNVGYATYVRVKPQEVNA